MNKQKTASLPAVGLSSLLVIFAVLCLVVFALLAVSTARADARLSRQTRQAIAGYYQAELEAHTILAQLRSGQIPPEVTENDGIFSFRCTVSPTQALEVQVRVTGDAYTVLRWQTVSTADWHPNETIPVWDGQG